MYEQAMQNGEACPPFYSFKPPAGRLFALRPVLHSGRGRDTVFTKQALLHIPTERNPMEEVRKKIKNLLQFVFSRLVVTILLLLLQVI